MSGIATDLGATGGRLGPPVRAKARRHAGRWIAAALALLLGVVIVKQLVTNERLHWDVVGQYLFNEEILKGLRLTVILTVSSMAVAILLGVLLAVMRLSPNPVLSCASRLYIWFFRGTPLLVQMLFWAYASAAFPTLGLGIPFGPSFVELDTNTLIPLFVAGLLALGLNEAAYTAETVRAGIMSVDSGQIEAGSALGMSRARLMRRIVLPQAMRIIVPPLGSATISMLKTTSLVYTIALPELLTSAKIIYGNNFQQIPLLIVVCFWYLALTTVLSLIQSRIERRVGRGFTRGDAGRARRAEEEAR